MGAIEPTRLPTVHSLGGGLPKDLDEAEALRAFDAYFLGELLRRSAPSNPSGLFDGGEAGRMYQDHYYQELARIVAATGEFGFAASLEGSLADPAGDGPAAETRDDGEDER